MTFQRMALQNRFRVPGFGFQDWTVRIRVSGFGFRDSGTPLKATLQAHANRRPPEDASSGSLEAEASRRSGNAFDASSAVPC